MAFDGFNRQRYRAAAMRMWLGTTTAIPKAAGHGLPAPTVARFVTVNDPRLFGVAVRAGF